MTIHRILGLQNSGKTFYLAIKLFFDYMHGNKIYSNTPLQFPYTLINLDFLLNYVQKGYDIKNASFGLDEYWIWADGRRATSKVNIISSYMLLQSSKNNLNIYTTSQTNEQDDRRLRDNAHFRTYCEREIKKGDKFYSLVSDKRKLGEPYDSMLYLTFDTEKKTIYGWIPYKRERIKAKRFFTLFNTERRIYYKELKL